MQECAKAAIHLGRDCRAKLIPLGSSDRPDRHRDWLEFERAAMARRMLNRSRFLPIGKGEVVQVGSVCGLVIVAVHLVVDGDAPPTLWNGERRISLADISGHAVEFN